MLSQNVASLISETKLLSCDVKYSVLWYFSWSLFFSHFFEYARLLSGDWSNCSSFSCTWSSVITPCSSSIPIGHGKQPFVPHLLSFLPWSSDHLSQNWLCSANDSPALSSASLLSVHLQLNCRELDISISVKEWRGCWHDYISLVTYLILCITYPPITIIQLHWFIPAI